MNGPRVLHVCAVEYGARTLLMPQLRHQAERGFDVRLACAPDAGDFGADLARFRPEAVPFPRDTEILQVARAMRRYRAVVDDIRPDIVHLHSSAAAAAARLLPRWSLGGRPRVVFTVHGFPFQWSELDRFRPRVFEGIERLLARKTDMVLFQSEEDLAECRARGYRSRLRFLGNGVQEGWFELDPPTMRPGRLRLLFIGRLIRAKGILDLLAAAARIPEVELRVAGGRLESERDDIRQELAQWSADPRLAGRVEFLGAVHPEKMRATMAWADAFALPTFHDEGVPRSIIEAMAAGRPVVVSNVKGCRELVDDGVEGCVVEARDVDGLELALRRLIDEPAARARMGAAGRKRAWLRHREQDVLRRLEDAYGELGIAAPAGISRDAMTPSRRDAAG